jgi:ubiquinone/menaquinone biosynthesis C-methylase UbiE
MSQVESMFSDGEAYERSIGRWSREVGQQFLEWMAIPAGLRWLDVGCGNGAFTEEIIARSAPSAVIGLDPSQEQIDHARRRAAGKMAEYQTGDAQALPFAEGAFDAAMMALVISFVPDPAGAVAQMARVVRPGGWVGAYMWDFAEGGVPTYPLSAGAKDLGITFAQPYSVDVSRLHVLRDLWLAGGLAEVETRTIRIRVRHESFDAFWNSNGKVGPSGKAVASLEPEVRAQLQEHLRATMPAGPDGGIEYDAWANAVKGRVAER